MKYRDRAFMYMPDDLILITDIFDDRLTQCHGLHSGLRVKPVFVARAICRC
jgi:hypothetical protein